MVGTRVPTVANHGGTSTGRMVNGSRSWAAMGTQGEGGQAQGDDGGRGRTGRAGGGPGHRRPEPWARSTITPSMTAANRSATPASRSGTMLASTGSWSKSRHGPTAAPSDSASRITSIAAQNHSRPSRRNQTSPMTSVATMPRPR